MSKDDETRQNERVPNDTGEHSVQDVCTDDAHHDGCGLLRNDDGCDHEAFVTGVQKQSNKEGRK